jgi:hypothetical protein
VPRTEWVQESRTPQPIAIGDGDSEQLADVQLLLGVPTEALPLYREALRMWEGAEDADPRIAARLHAKVIQTLGRLFLHIDRVQFRALRQEAETPRAALLASLEAARADPPSPERRPSVTGARH